MRSCGYAFCAALTATSVGPTRSPALSASPLMSKVTSAEWPSFEMSPVLPGSPGAVTLVATETAETRSRTSLIAALNAGSPAFSVALWMSASSCAGRGKCAWSACSAVPDSPLYSSAVVSFWVPTMPPIATARITKTSHPASTDFLCRALQLPMRAAIPAFCP